MKAHSMLCDMSGMKFLNSNVREVIGQQARFPIAKLKMFALYHQISFHSYHTKIFKEQQGENPASMFG